MVGIWANFESRHSIHLEPGTAGGTYPQIETQHWVNLLGTGPTPAQNFAPVQGSLLELPKRPLS